MPRKKKILVDEKQKTLLGNLPPRVSKVQVRKGDDILWISPDEVRSEHTLMLGPDGVPVYLKKPSEKKEELILIEGALNIDLKQSDLYELSADEESVSGKNNDRILFATLQELAKETVFLDSVRVSALTQQKSPTAVANISARRATILKNHADLLLRFHEMKQKRKRVSLDLESPIFGKLLSFIVHTFRDCMVESSVDAFTVNMVLAELTSKLDTHDWLLAAKRSMDE